MSLESLRRKVCQANQALHTSGLVTMHSGNVSALDRASRKLLIKPSGMDYSAMTPEDMVEVDFENDSVVAGSRKPSVDLPHHLFLYRNIEDIGSVVHTHSNYATAFAACGKPIPVVLTAIADEFGGEIPCAPYTGNEADSIGRAIIAHRSERSPAILLENHGVFAWGNDVTSALKAAVMVEDVAKTVWLALQIGEPAPIPDAEVEKWWDRYRNLYGQ